MQHHKEGAIDPSRTTRTSASGIHAPSGNGNGSGSGNGNGDAGDDPRFASGGEDLGLDAGGVAALRASLAAWRAGPVAEAERKVPPRRERFSTWRGVEVPDLVTPTDKPVRYRDELGLPGEYPFTRGVQPTMYRGRLWTMRMFAGFGTPEQTNARFKFARVKAERDAAAVRSALAAVREAARGKDNLMPPIIDAARAYCSEQEICDVLREVMGTYSDPAEF